VPRFEPFRALRYASADLDPLIAPPYDVLSDAEVAELAARDPHNIVHVDVPTALPDQTPGDDPYARAAARLGEWVERGVLVSDKAASFTIYRMRFTDAAGVDRDISGVIGGLEVVDDGAGGVLPHERTTPKASTDRLDLTRATEANLSPIWGLSLARGLSELLAVPADPVGSVTVDGVEHVVERVTDPARIAALRSHIAADDVLIADGHHRYSISRTYRDEVRDATGRSDTPAEATLAFVSELVQDQLSVEAIHRLYTGVLFDDLRTALEDAFELRDAEPPSPTTLAEMQATGRLLLIGPTGEAWWLDPRPSAFEGVRALDGAWLEHAIGELPVDVSYQHGLGQVLEAIDAGRAMAAVLIRPVSVAEIEHTAREGVLMPPKSTFFTPKLRTGFVIRPLTA